ncbi:flagellar M-ring protein FliF [Thermovibrio guaymasensis]|uniref:Flagellar M-ring protein n=1 Tax=Thermovibrio guaymasensis TaxID=240167 RepID=A0A420W7F0_9BACT|nr:flagellar basal-body MS-ring/collar protein FliF [Thermovibrio guaymasensis]RKQ63251.1 flagellar M-ring protein FliF [Thermovibrio guaymasensis]
MEVKEIQEKFKNFLSKNANPRNIALVLGALAILSIVSFVLIRSSSNQDYAVLYTHLSPDDAGQILSVLQEEKIPYKVVGDGSIILVPKDKVYDVRLKLAAKGLPHGKVVGFEIFDQPKLGITQFQQNIEYIRALEGELERTIKRIDAVRDVKVNIALPRDSIFVRETSEPKASVLVNLWPGKDLTKEQVKAIVFLVSHAVPGLKPENVTVVDNRGRVLTDLIEEESGEEPSKELKIKKQLERDIERKVRELLSRALGSSKVVVSASVEIETGKLERKREIYDPDMTAVVSQRKIQEKETSVKRKPQGPAGTPTNVPPVINTQTQGETLKREKKDVTTNYDVSKTVESTVAPIFKIKRITVGVLVDGKYEEIKEKDGTIKYKFVPRSPQEIKTYEEIVKSAIGYDPKRGDKVTVASIPFESALFAKKEKEKEFPWYYLLAAALVLLGISGVVVFKILKGREEKVPSEIQQVSPELIEQMREKVTQEEGFREVRIENDPIYLKIVEIAKDYPDLIVNVISKWLKEK